MTKPHHTWRDDDPTYATQTHTHDWRPTGAKYTSARHAVEQWLHLRCAMRGQPAIDYEEAMAVDTSPTPENPASLQAHEAFFLESKVFRPTQHRVKSRYWRVWVAIRRHHASLREAARAEQVQRRDEIGETLDLEELEAWCANYDVEFPVADLRGWCECRGIEWEHVEARAGGDPDRWDVLQTNAGISQQTAKRYRDRVDAVVEEFLVDHGALVRWAIKDEEDVRVDTRNEQRRRRTPAAE